MQYSIYVCLMSTNIIFFTGSVMWTQICNMLSHGQNCREYFLRLLVGVIHSSVHSPSFFIWTLLQKERRGTSSILETWQANIQPNQNPIIYLLFFVGKLKLLCWSISPLRCFWFNSPARKEASLFWVIVQRRIFDSSTDKLMLLLTKTVRGKKGKKDGFDLSVFGQISLP